MGCPRKGGVGSGAVAVGRAQIEGLTWMANELHRSSAPGPGTVVRVGIGQQGTAFGGAAQEPPPALDVVEPGGLDSRCRRAAPKRRPRGPRARL